MPLSDSHIHLFEKGFPGKYGTMFPHGGELRIYNAIRKAHGIERALVIGYEGDAWARGNNRYIAALARRRKWIAPLAFCSLKNAPSAKRFESWWKSGFRGIAMYVYTDADLKNFLALHGDAVKSLNRKRAIISLNVPMALTGSLRPALERLGQAQILFSHCGLPGALPPKFSAKLAAKLLRPLLQLADLPHVGVKLSGAYDCGAYPHHGIEHVFGLLHRRFGASRICWGSDFCPALQFVSFGQTIDLIDNHFDSRAAGKKIFHANLKRMLNHVR